MEHYLGLDVSIKDISVASSIVRVASYRGQSGKRARSPIVAARFVNINQQMMMTGIRKIVSGMRHPHVS
jgi:hypothetical protein